jgi:peroxiredoxin
VHLPIIDFRPYAIGKSIPDGMEYVGEVDPPIHDFYLESSEGDDLTDQVLSEAKVMLVVSYNLSKSDKAGFVNVKDVSDRAIANGYKVYALSASSGEDFEKIKSKYKLDFEMLFCDETALKTVIRANPGVLTLEKGVVTGKWSWTDAEKVKF